LRTRVIRHWLPVVALLAAARPALADDVGCTSTTFRLFGVWKNTKVIRMYDAKRNALVYVAISRKVIEGSPMNAVSAVPIARWETR
jgi:CreA protein